MLDRDERRLDRWARINIAGGIVPSLTLLEDLILFLNRAKTSRGKKIVMILEQMLVLEKLTTPIKIEEPIMIYPSLEKSDPVKFKLHLEISQRTTVLNRELSKYRFTPHAAVVGGGGGQGPSEWAAYWRGDFDREKQLRMTASEALELILKLTQSGDLSRLRRCNRCQKWLYARFRHQVFCSTICQQKNYTSTEKWKAHRRRYMRKRYRQLFKSGNVGRKTR